VSAPLGEFRPAAPRRAVDPFRYRGFPALWAAETVSGFGTYITTIALQVLVVLTLGGRAFDVGLLNASRWLPYLLLGLVVGALVERRRRKPILVSTDLGRGILLGLIPLFYWLGWLNLPVLLAFVAVFGLFTLLNDASSMSFVPRLVPPEGLLAANARLDQSASVAQTSGPLLAGGLVSLIGAPLAVVVDAASYVFSALAVWRIPVLEPPPTPRTERMHLRRDIADGLRFIYHHRTLKWMAIGGHTWFLFNSMLITVFVPFALLSLGLTPLELGITLASAGLFGLVGAVLATTVGRRLGAGPAVIVGYIIQPLGWTCIALTPMNLGGYTGVTVIMLAIGQGLYGFALGLQNANEMGYRQAVTPDALQSRTNITMRSFNRAMIVVGAPLGGFLADSIGYRPTFWIGVGGFVVVALMFALSPFRGARHPDGRPEPRTI
jgi:MFS family permease